jgi:acyl-CoA synthetase (AMP-forming)/AMP-acid ligase II
VRDGPGTVSASADFEVVTAEILDACRRALAPYKIPAAIRFVPSLDVTPSGKLARRGS